MGFEIRQNGGEEFGVFTGGILFQLRNLGKYVNKDVSSKRRGNAATYDHTRNDATNNPCAPDLEINLRWAGGVEIVLNVLNVIKAESRRILERRIWAIEAEEPDKIHNSLREWDYRDCYVGHDWVNATGKGPPVDLEFSEICSCDRDIGVEGYLYGHVGEDYYRYAKSASELMFSEHPIKRIPCENPSVKRTNV